MERSNSLVMVRNTFDNFGRIVTEAFIHQSMLLRRYIIELRSNIYWAGVYCVILCDVALRANMVEAYMPSHGFLSSSTLFCTLKVRRILPIVWHTLF